MLNCESVIHLFSFSFIHVMILLCSFLSDDDAVGAFFLDITPQLQQT